VTVAPEHKLRLGVADARLIGAVLGPVRHHVSALAVVVGVVGGVMLSVEVPDAADAAVDLGTLPAGLRLGFSDSRRPLGRVVACDSYPARRRRENVTLASPPTHAYREVQW
jgi:hypothetical protein